MKGKCLSILNYWFSFFSARKFKKELSKQKPDVIHFHNVFPKLGPRLIKIASDFNIPTVVTIHNFRYSCANGLFLREGKVCTKCLKDSSFVRPFLLKCYRNSRIASFILGFGAYIHQKNNYYNHADVIVVMTEFAKKIIVNYGVDESKVVVKHHSVNSTAINVNNTAQVVQHDVCFVGRLSVEKGLGDVFVALNKTNSKLSVGIVGDGQLMSSLKRESQSLNVMFYGWLNHELVLDVIQHSKFLVFPSIWFETFGLVIIEAFSQGKPVIARNIGGVSELIEEGVDGFLYNSDSQLSDILGICENMSDEEYRCMSQAASRSYQEKFMNHNNLDNLLSIYKMVKHT